MTDRIACSNPFTAIREISQSTKEETEADDCHSNLPDDFVDGHEQDNEERGVS